MKKIWEIQNVRVTAYLTATTLPSDNGMPRNWAIKIAATASYNAVPSMFTVAPMGNIKREICGFILFLSSMHWIVTGNVAELNEKKNHARLNQNPWKSK